MLPHLPASLVILFSLTAVVVAVPSDTTPSHGIEPRATSRKCASDPTPEAVSKMEELFAGLRSENRASDAAGYFTVPVYFNVIYASKNGDYGGYVSLVFRPPSCPAFSLFPLSIPEMIRSKNR